MEDEAKTVIPEILPGKGFFDMLPDSVQESVSEACVEAIKKDHGLKILIGSAAVFALGYWIGSGE